jgi:hypothetical protein
MRSRSRRAIWIGAAGVLAVAVVAVGAIVLLRPPAPSPPPSVSPSPSASPLMATPVGVYAFTAGAQNVEHPADVIAKLATSSFKPNGIDWVIGWKLLEPAPGQYAWPLVDNDLSAARNAGYGSFVEIIPGEDTPSWALAQCPTVHLTLQNTGEPVTICVPTSAQFLDPWTQMITAFGHRYDGAPGLTMVQATGCGVQGEMQLPDHSASFWAPYGLTTPTLLSAWERVLSAWRAALPETPSSLAIEEPLGNGNSDVLHPLITYAHSHFGPLMWLQQNGLRQGTQTSPGSYGGDLAAASQYTTVGWQMFGAGAANGNLASALGDGLAVHPRFYEVYLSDIVSTTSGPTLNQLRAGALAAPAG